MIQHYSINAPSMPGTATIGSSKEVLLEFEHGGITHRYTITKWKGTKFHTFLGLAVLGYGEDGRFGTMDEFGTVTASSEQKTAAIMQAVDDIVHYVDTLGRVQGNLLQDYALWYRDKHPETETYRELIQHEACKLICATGLTSKRTHQVIPFEVQK